MDIKNVRVIVYGDKIFKYADVVKVTTVDDNVYIGQIMRSDDENNLINNLFIFELNLEDNSDMPFYKYDIKDIEKADNAEIFNYAFNLGQNMKTE